jgi:hypothetical protein
MPTYTDSEYLAIGKISVLSGEIKKIEEELIVIESDIKNLLTAASGGYMQESTSAINSLWLKYKSLTSQLLSKRGSLSVLIPAPVIATQDTAPTGGI